MANSAPSHPPVAATEMRAPHRVRPTAEDLADVQAALAQVAGGKSVDLTPAERASGSAPASCQRRLKHASLHAADLAPTRFNRRRTTTMRADIWCTLATTRPRSRATSGVSSASGVKANASASSITSGATSGRPSMAEVVAKIDRGPRGAHVARRRLTTS
jgi:hypothetical protein